MSFFNRSYDYTKEHLALDQIERDGGVDIICVHCKKTVESRGAMPDYGMFMGAVWISKNLPCMPYEKPSEEEK